MTPDDNAASEKASSETVSDVLWKALTGGELSRIPRHPRNRDIVLAMLCLGMQRRHAYTEPELGAYLISMLTDLRAQVDHVTCRRYLVDFGFVKRDRAGSRYYLSYAKIESTLSDDVLNAGAGLLKSALASRRRKGNRPD